jgi:CheY-specific phosphatase CheX
METNEIQSVLAAAVEEVLETMCFTAVLASSEGAAPAEDGARAVTAQLSFQGSPSGAFRVSVPSNLARVVAASFLGWEELEVSDSQAGEMVCELANMVCGAVLSRLESGSAFHLFHPELTDREAAVNPESAGVARWFDLGEGMILTASLELQSGL